MAGLRDDPTKATTRLLLNRNQFSRVIGKGGNSSHLRLATISHAFLFQAQP